MIVRVIQPHFGLKVGATYRRDSARHPKDTETTWAGLSGIFDGKYCNGIVSVIKTYVMRIDGEAAGDLPWMLQFAHDYMLRDATMTSLDALARAKDLISAYYMAIDPQAELITKPTQDEATQETVLSEAP